MLKKYKLLELLKNQAEKEFTANDLAELMSIDRTNISRYLNELYKEGTVVKTEGRPIKYKALGLTKSDTAISFDNLIGSNGSLDTQIKKGKAAMMYPPRGLHTIIFGETGTGKSMFAECMYHFAVESQILEESAPFITFNCADYAQNPQLLFAHVFGVKRGAYTGAEETREGLVTQADGGILFLDEIHRLPPEGQEMLFTFIDKGIYRSMGSNEEKRASVQIIGATTGSSETFLATFNRRIPMQIDMPPLEERGLDENLAIIQDFLQQESNRLSQEIEIDQRSLVAFMLYQPDGNIGQLKRDLKLVCAKAFLNYHTSNESKGLVIQQEMLPLHVQKGLLRTNEQIDKISPIIDSKNVSLHFDPGKEEVAWGRDPQQDMEVYNSISYKLDMLDREEYSSLIDLGDIISKDVDRYFETYVEELYRPTVYQELITDDLWNLVNELYESAQERLKRDYDEKARFAFALHLTSMVDRLVRNEKIIHPNLNDIRREYADEFHVALDLSMKIEDKYHVMIPLDEIGFITMFLTAEISENKEVLNRQVEVIVIMHGNSTATSMLETCQDLLGIKHGMAFNMPLTMKTKDMYQQFYHYVESLQEQFSEGILLLTDMGSPGTFGHLIEKELGVPTKVITMASTMVVLESLRLTSLGRSLDDIHETVNNLFMNIVQPIKDDVDDRKDKVIIVACFTGEGVAKKLKTVVSRLIEGRNFDVLELQFLEKESFKARVSQIMETKHVVAIVGTVEIRYKGIPFIPAIDIFNKNKVVDFQNLIEAPLKASDIASSLSDEFSATIEVRALYTAIEKVLNDIRRTIDSVIPNEVIQGIMMHIAFLIKDKVENKEAKTEFKQLIAFIEANQELYGKVVKELSALEKQFNVVFSDNELAYIVYMFKENTIEIYK